MLCRFERINTQSQHYSSVITSDWMQMSLKWGARLTDAQHRAAVNMYRVEPLLRRRTHTAGKCDCGSMQGIFCAIVRAALNVESFLKHLICFSWQPLWYHIEEMPVCGESFMCMMRPVFSVVYLKVSSSLSTVSEHTMTIFTALQHLISGSCSHDSGCEATWRLTTKFCLL